MHSMSTGQLSYSPPLSTPQSNDKSSVKLLLFITGLPKTEFHQKCLTITSVFIHFIYYSIFNIFIFSMYPESKVFSIFFVYAHFSMLSNDSSFAVSLILCHDLFYKNTFTTLISCFTTRLELFEISLPYINRRGTLWCWTVSATNSAGRGGRVFLTYLFIQWAEM